MRLLKEEALEYDADFRDTPVSPSTAAEAAPPLPHKCFPRDACGPWWPYSSAQDLKTNTTLVLLILFFAFLCVLALNAAVRYMLRRRRSSTPTHRRANYDDDKAAAGSKAGADEEAGAAVPTVIFSAAAEEGGGVASEECAICLGEFVEGERVRVLENCKHCFHIRCIQRWLNAHSSCPTCRAASHWVLFCSRRLSTTSTVTIVDPVFISRNIWLSFEN